MSVHLTLSFFILVVLFTFGKATLGGLGPPNNNVHFFADIVPVLTLARKLDTGECNLTFQNFFERVDLALSASDTGQPEGQWSKDFVAIKDSLAYRVRIIVEVSILMDGGDWVFLKGFAQNSDTGEVILEFGVTYDLAKKLEAVSFHGVGPKPSNTCSNRAVLNIGNIKTVRK